MNMARLLRMWKRPIKDEQPEASVTDFPIAKVAQCRVAPVFDSSQFLVPSFGRPLSSVTAGKLVVFGLPKSGNVWLVSMLADYLGVPAVDPFLDVDKSGVGMCHLPLAKVIGRTDFVQAVYLLRDLRDIVVSYFHYGNTEGFRSSLPNYHYEDIETFYFDWFLPRVVPFHEVSNHATDFSTAGLPVVRYERLHADTYAEMRRLILRLGLPLDEKHLQKVVDANRLSELKKAGKQLNTFVPVSHFRHGGHGGYKTELPLTVLRHLNSKFFNVLAEFGYETDLSNFIAS